jgi:hypothetical protein
MLQSISVFKSGRRLLVQRHNVKVSQFLLPHKARLDLYLSGGLYYFLTDAAINDHKLKVLGQHEFITLHFWRSEMGLDGLKSRYWQGCILSSGSKEESIHLHFPASRRLRVCLAFVPIPVLSKPATWCQVLSCCHLSGSHSSFF